MPVSGQTPDTHYYTYAYDLISNRTRADVTVDGLTTSQLQTYDASSPITNSGFSYDAGELTLGTEIIALDGAFGTVAADAQPMYNLTVDTAD